LVDTFIGLRKNEVPLTPRFIKPSVRLPAEREKGPVAGLTPMG